MTPYLAPDAYDLFEQEREGLLGNVYFALVRELLVDDISDRVLEAIRQTHMVFADSITADMVVRALQAPVHLYLTLPLEKIAVTRGQPGSGSVAEIRFNANRQLSIDQFSHVLIHELRHVMQNEAGIAITGDQLLTYVA